MATILYGKEISKSISQSIESKSSNIYGLGFPTGSIGGKGYFNKAVNLELLKNNIKQFILTYKGDRVMLPTYGLNLGPYLFEPLDEDLVSDIRMEIETQFAIFFSGVVITKLRILGSDKINYEGGHGLRIELDLLATQIDNNIFTVGATIT